MKFLQSEKQKVKEEKWTEPEGSLRHYQGYQRLHDGSPWSKERERSRKHIRKIMGETFKLDENP